MQCYWSTGNNQLTADITEEKRLRRCWHDSDGANSLGACVGNAQVAAVPIVGNMV